MEWISPESLTNLNQILLVTRKVSDRNNCVDQFHLLPPPSPPGRTPGDLYFTFSGLQIPRPPARKKSAFFHSIPIFFTVSVQMPPPPPHGTQGPRQIKGYVRGGGDDNSWNWSNEITVGTSRKFLKGFSANFKHFFARVAFFGNLVIPYHSIFL